MKPIISIVGRPNVGKSTIFNRFIGYRKAITEDIPGVTRDRNYGDFEYNGITCTLVDTGGFEPLAEEGYFPLIAKQIEVSMEESSAILFVLDCEAGLLPQDREIANILRRYHKPFFVVVNKVDSQKRELAASEFYALGTEKLYPVSALHGTGIAELLEDIIESVREEALSTGEGEENPHIVKIALVGRPNTGKSSITNRILGSERMIVSDVPGTTRDAIDTRIVYGEKELLIIDTAGLRRKSKVSQKIEEYSVSSAIKTIERADVVNLVIDASEGASHQDAAIAHLIMSRGKGLCLVVNKWDLTRGNEQSGYRDIVKERIPHASYAPLIFASALKGQNMEKIVETDLRVYGQLKRRISTPKLNTSFEEFFRRHAISYQKGKQVKIYYVHQAKASCPTFVLFSNFPRLVPEHYRRYLENSLREAYGFHGAPIRLIFKKK